MQSAGKKINLEKLCKNLIKKNKSLNEEEKKDLLEYVLKQSSSYDHFLNNYQFGYYLAGLIEGDGCFTKNGLSLCFHEKDLATAEWLQDRIGYGNIYKAKDKKAYHYEVTSKEGMLVVLNLVNGKFVTPYKISQMYKFDFEKKYSMEIKPINLNSDFKNNAFLAGFFDADACFAVFIRKFQKESIRPKPVMRIAIGLKYKDILTIIQQNFNGALRELKNGVWWYETSTFKVNLEFIKYFEKHTLLSTKFIEFLKWKEVYTIYKNKQHLTEDGLNQILNIKNIISKIRK